MAPSNTEILYELGVGEQIIATTSLCDYPGRVTEKPSVGGWTNTDIEKVKEMEPDLALASDDLQDEIVSKLEGSDIQVVQVKPHTLEEVYESTRRIGELVDREEEAEELVERMKSDIESVDLEGKRIYCEEWMNPSMVSGNWIPGLIKKANAHYFIEEGTRSRKFDLEELKEFDPEYIFLNVCGTGENIDPKEVLEREKWQDIEAVKNGNVFVIDDALLNRPGPRLVQGLEQIESLI